jgi:hypothetical protein
MINSQNNSEENTTLDKDIVKFLVKDNLKTTYASLLEKDYATPRPRGKVVSIKSYIWKAAIFLLATSTFLYYMSLPSSSPTQMAMNYAKTTPVLGNQNVMRKDNTLLSSMRLSANDAFVQKKYNEAAQLYMKITDSNEAMDIDRFYLSLSLLKSENPNAKKAIENLLKIQDTENFKYETQWFLALAYCIEKDYVNCELYLQKVLSNNAFMTKEATQLLDAIKKNPKSTPNNEHQKS